MSKSPASRPTTILLGYYIHHTFRKRNSSYIDQLVQVGPAYLVLGRRVLTCWAGLLVEVVEPVTGTTPMVNGNTATTVAQSDMLFGN